MFMNREKMHNEGNKKYLHKHWGQGDFSLIKEYFRSV